jgi:amino acid transporter
MIAAIGLGVFYTVVSWITIAGNGEAKSIAISRGSTGNAFDLFYGVTQANLGGFAKDVYLLLAVTGSFACALAFHNAASRYIYAHRQGGASPPDCAAHSAPPTACTGRRTWPRSCRRRSP